MSLMPKMSIFLKLYFGMDDALANCHCEGFILDVAGISTLSVFKDLHVKKLRECNFHQVLNLNVCRQLFSQSYSYLCPQMTKLWSLQIILAPDKDLEPASGYA